MKDDKKPTKPEGTQDEILDPIETAMLTDVQGGVGAGGGKELTEKEMKGQSGG